MNKKRAKNNFITHEVFKFYVLNDKKYKIKADIFITDS